MDCHLCVGAAVEMPHSFAGNLSNSLAADLQLGDETLVYLTGAEENHLGSVDLCRALFLVALGPLAMAFAKAVDASVVVVAAADALAVVGHSGWVMVRHLDGHSADAVESPEEAAVAAVVVEVFVASPDFVGHSFASSDLVIAFDCLKLIRNSGQRMGLEQAFHRLSLTHRL